VKRIALVVTATFLFIGCGGPTKAGLEARAKAHERMDSVNADLAAQQAKQQFEVGQLDRAIETINAAIARYSANGHYHLLRGRILLEQHRLDAAFHALTEATVHTPDLAEPHYFLGVLHQRWGEDDKALESYKRAMQKDSTHPQYLLATAETHVALQQYDEAIEMLTTTSHEFQHHPSVASLLGQIYLATGQPELATTWFEDSRLLGGHSTESLTALATTQFQSGMYAECLHSLALLEGEQESLSLTFLRIKGKCLSATGRQIEGRDICLMVTRETPDIAGAWVDLGYIAWQMGDYSRLGVCGAKISLLDASLPEGALFEGIAAMHAGNDFLAKEKLLSLRSDNTIHGLEELLNTYAKSTKSESETANIPNMPLETAEGSIEPHDQELESESQPIASVPSVSPEAP
jgi:predicted negative regulator of RcsB-dependent stress response